MVLPGCREDEAGKVVGVEELSTVGVVEESLRRRRLGVVDPLIRLEHLPLTVLDLNMISRKALDL